jgi:hypothetical protein
VKIDHVASDEDLRTQCRQMNDHVLKSFSPETLEQFHRMFEGGRTPEFYKGFSHGLTVSGLLLGEIDDPATAESRVKLLILGTLALDRWMKLSPQNPDTHPDTHQEASPYVG